MGNQLSKERPLLAGKVQKKRCKNWEYAKPVYDSNTDANLGNYSLHNPFEYLI